MRDKNKLKKLLVLLSVGAIVLTPVVGVFAFGTQKTNSDNNSDNQNHSLDEILVKTDLGTFAYNATDQAILSRLLTLNDAGDSSVGSGLSLDGNTVSGTIAVDGKTYSGSIDITYTKNSAPELYKDLALLFDDTNLGTVDYNKVDLNNLDEVSKWAKDHLDSKNHFSNLVLENEISNIISKITFGTPSINEDGSGTITASVSDETPIQLNGRNYSGTVTLVFKTTHLKIKDISVIQDDLSNLLNDSTMTTTEWEVSSLLNRKLGGSSIYRDKTLIELGVEVTSSSHSDLVPTKDYTFKVGNDSNYFIKDSTITITHKLDVSVVSNVIIAALDDVAKNGSGSDIPAITNPESWWTEWDEYLNSSNSHLLADKIKPDGWEHGLNYYGFGINEYTDDNDQHYLEIKLNSSGDDLGFNTSSDDDANSYILWSYGQMGLNTLITNGDSMGAIPVESTTNNDSIVEWLKKHLKTRHGIDDLSSDEFKKITFGTPSINENGTGTISISVSSSEAISYNGKEYSGISILSFTVNHEKTGSHPLDKLLTELNLGTFAYNATDQAILSRLLTLNDAGDSSVGSGLSLDGNTVSGTITVDGKTYSGSVDITYTKNSEPESRKDLALLITKLDLGTIDYNKVDLNNSNQVKQWAIDHIKSNHVADSYAKLISSDDFEKITFSTPSINEDGTGTIVATVSDDDPIQLDGTKFFGKITLTFKTTHLKIQDISVIEDDLSNLLNDSTMATTEWTTSELLAKKLGGDSKYRDKTLTELGIEITSSSHSDLVSTKDYTFTAKEGSQYFTKDSTITITHKLDASVVSNVIIAALDDVAKNGSGSDIPAITNPESWWTEWDEYLNSSNSHLLADKIKPDGWEHGLNYYGFGINEYTDDNDQHYLKIQLNSYSDDLGLNTSSDDDANSYILWSFTPPEVDNISVIQEELTSLVNDKNDSAWNLSDLQGKKLGGDSNNKDKTLTQLGITVTLATDNKLSGTNNVDKTEKLTFMANGMSYSGSIDIEHNYTETTFVKDDISIIQDDLSNLLNDSTMTTTEWTISGLLDKKLGGDSEYKDKTLSELGIDISQADHNGSEKHKNNDENVSNVQDYTFTAKESSEYFTKDTSTTITHNLDISVVADEIKSWLDAAAYGEKTSAGIDAVTDPDNWFSWASSNTSKLQEKTMSDVWNHALQKYGFTVSKSKDADGNDCLKITFDSDDYDLGFNASSDDDENSYILWSFSLPSVDNISVIQEELTSLVNKEKDKAWDLTELQSEKLGGDSNNKDKTLSELGITVTLATDNKLSGTNNVDKTEKLTFMANGMSYSGSIDIEHNYTETTFVKDDISIIQDDLSNLLNKSSMTTTEWETDDLLAEKLGGTSEYKDKTLSELGIDVEKTVHNSDTNTYDYIFSGSDDDSNDHPFSGSTSKITHLLSISTLEDKIKGTLNYASESWTKWGNDDADCKALNSKPSGWSRTLKCYGIVAKLISGDEDVSDQTWRFYVGTADVAYKQDDNGNLVNDSDASTSGLLAGEDDYVEYVKAVVSTTVDLSKSNTSAYQFLSDYVTMASIDVDQQHLLQYVKKLDITTIQNIVDEEFGQGAIIVSKGSTYDAESSSKGTRMITFTGTGNVIDGYTYTSSVIFKWTWDNNKQITADEVNSLMRMKLPDGEHPKYYAVTDSAGDTYFTSYLVNNNNTDGCYIYADAWMQNTMSYSPFYSLGKFAEKTQEISWDNLSVFGKDDWTSANATITNNGTCYNGYYYNDDTGKAIGQSINSRIPGTTTSAFRIEAAQGVKYSNCLGNNSTLAGGHYCLVNGKDITLKFLVKIPGYKEFGLVTKLTLKCV